LDEGSIRGRASRSRGGRCRIFQRLYIISSWLPARRIGQVRYVRPRPIIFEEGGRFARVSPPPGAPVAPIVVESGHSSTFGQPWEFFDIPSVAVVERQLGPADGPGRVEQMVAYEWRVRCLELHAAGKRLGSACRRLHGSLPTPCSFLKLGSCRSP
jgi:hypothetical protein